MNASGPLILPRERSLQALTNALQSLVARLESDPSLIKPDHLRQRLEALDRLDAYFSSAPATASSAEPLEPELYRRARAIFAKLESLNGELYQVIRSEIQRGSPPDALLGWVHSLDMDVADGTANRISYDFPGYNFLDDLISGVLQFEDPGSDQISKDPELVFYQPTPARHIFHLIRLAALTASDVLFDLGSGLGHVALLAAICTPARSVGIELEAAYVERARQCAQTLNLDNVTFIHQDARAADFSAGTVFYLYTPFLGSILSAVLTRLRHEAATRRLCIYAYGPCTSVIARESWLEAAAVPEAQRITLFASRD
jgi:SAM-dependent methyltransferase